jgi:hypothetical protein
MRRWIFVFKKKLFLNLFDELLKYLRDPHLMLTNSHLTGCRIVFPLPLLKFLLFPVAILSYKHWRISPVAFGQRKVQY